MVIVYCIPLSDSIRNTLTILQCGVVEVYANKMMIYTDFSLVYLAYLLQRCTVRSPADQLKS